MDELGKISKYLEFLGFKNAEYISIHDINKDYYTVSFCSNNSKRICYIPISKLKSRWKKVELIYDSQTN